MNSERYQLVKKVFQGALDRTLDERPAYLAEACGKDEELKREVLILLDADRSAASFIETSPMAAINQLLKERPDDNMVGRRIGPYEVMKQLGRGGMGTVYMAGRADDQFRKLVAIKLVRQGIETEPIIR